MIKPSNIFKMNKKLFKVILGPQRLMVTMSCVLFHGFGLAQEEKPKKPNILFIYTDDLGYGDIGVFFQNQRKNEGDRSKPWMSTPNLDQMAKTGAMLTQHYAAAPVCAPSRASLLTGLSQGHANVRNNQFDKALTNNHTLGNVLQKAGYATSVIGKWGLQGDRRWSYNNGAWTARPIDRGFDYFYGYMQHRDGHEHYPNEGLYRGKKSVWENTTEINSGLDKCYTGDLWTAAAKRWIIDKVESRSQPFFMFLSYDTPHAVLELPTQAYPEGGGLKGGLQWVGKLGQMINTASGNPDSYFHPDYEHATYDHDNDQTTAEILWPETFKRYATSVRRIDDAIGDIIQLLKDLKIEDNTLVVFSSDNGPSKESYLPENFVENTPDFFDSFGPFDGIKRDVLEGGLRVPTIARWPGSIPENTVVTTPNISYDWLPTFTDAAGLPSPANSDGVSLLPTLTGVGDQKKGTVYIEYFQNGKTPDYKEFSPQNRNRVRKEMQVVILEGLIGLRYDVKSADDDFEIYDVGKDTHQSNNLALFDSLNPIQKRMKDRVLQVRMPDTSAVRPYDGEAIPALRPQPRSKGLRWKSYGGNFPWLPKMDDLVNNGSGTVKNPSKIRYNKINSDYFLLEGYIEIKTKGNYELRFSSVDKAIVRVHDITVFDADYGYNPSAEMMENMYFEEGFHPIRIYLKNSKKERNPFILSLKLEGSSSTAPVEFFVRDT